VLPCRWRGFPDNLLLWSSPLWLAMVEPLQRILNTENLYLKIPTYLGRTAGIVSSMAVVWNWQGSLTSLPRSRDTPRDRTNHRYLPCLCNYLDFVCKSLFIFFYICRIAEYLRSGTFRAVHSAAVHSAIGSWQTYRGIILVICM
jgi:hypothetical protein